MARAKPRSRLGARSRLARRARTVAIWLGVVAAIGGIFYGLANTSTIAYGERQLTAIDFSSLTSDQKHSALVEANGARCTCGCGMQLAQCVATDSTCPIRTDNIERIKTMVREAAAGT